jgi:hypothetical protein
LALAIVDAHSRLESWRAADGAALFGSAAVIAGESSDEALRVPAWLVIGLSGRRSISLPGRFLSR